MGKKEREIRKQVGNREGAWSGNEDVVRLIERRMRKIEMEEEKRKREMRKRNLIIKRVKAEKEGIEGFQEK